MHKSLFFLLALAAITTSASIVRDDLASKGIEYIGQEQVVPIAYLESSGTQYIDTGIFFNDPTHTYGWEITAQAIFSNYNSYNWFTGWYYGIPHSIGIYSDRETRYNFYPLNTYFQDGQSIGKGMTTGDKYGIVTHVFSKSDFTPDTSLVLFARVGSDKNTDARGCKRIFSFRVFDNSLLILDLLPVRIGNEGFMLDTISGELFANQGTGSFLLGPDIAPL